MNNEMPAVGYSSYGSAQAGNLNQHMANLAEVNQLNQMNQFASAQQLSEHYQREAAARHAPQEPAMAAPARRLVQVFIVDPDPRLPIEWCVIHEDDKPRITDATDQELFYEIDIRALLQVHNERRATVVDKNVKERVEHLEPARIRDLKMQIVEVATF